METRGDHMRDYELWDGDDYFAELKRQILLLTAVDDTIDRRLPSPGNEYRGSTGCRAYGHPGEWDRYKQGNNYPMLSKQMYSPLTGNGTGVFIPHIIPSRRRCHSGELYLLLNKIAKLTIPSKI